MQQKKVVIIGAGFAGLEAAKILVKFPNVQLTVIDRANHHLFQPLLYQVATAGLSPADISIPIRAVLSRAPNAQIIMANVQRIGEQNNRIILDHEEIISYDYLLVATGSRHSYFGKDAWEVYAPGLKTLQDAIEIRRRILLAFEKAERTADEKAREELLTFVIVGGGPTGIELAGAIAELARFALAKDFKKINPRKSRVLLLEASDKLLPNFSPKNSQAALKALQELQVEVLLNHMVTEVNANSVITSQQTIKTCNVIWAAGVRASSLGQFLAAERDRVGRVRVMPDLRIKPNGNIFVAGDLAAVFWKKENGKDVEVPGMAPGAMQGGRHAAQNILRLMQGKPTKPFRYVHKGSLATIGRARAVADFGSIRLSGYIAWLTWLIVHIFYLIGFRNRVLVLFQWAWSYVTFKKGTRLIT